MNEILKVILEKVGLEMFFINFVVTLGIVLIYMRVFKNFKQAKKQKDLKAKEVKSIVETTSMTRLFYSMLYCYNNRCWENLFEQYLYKCNCYNYIYCWSSI